MPLLITLAILAAKAQTTEPYVLANVEGRVIAASEDGSTMASMSSAGDVSVWHIPAKNAEPVLVQNFRPSDTAPDQNQDFTGLLSLSPKGERLAVLAPGNPVRVYDLHPFHETAELPLQSSGQYAWFQPFAMSWRPTTNRVLVIPNGTQSFLESRDGKTFKELPIGGSPAWTADGKKVAGLCQGGAAIVDLDTANVIQKFLEPLETFGPVLFSPDEKYLITGGEDPDWKGPDIGPNEPAPSEAAYVHQLKLKVWRLRDGKRLRLLPGFSSNMVEAEIGFMGPRTVVIDRSEAFDILTGRHVKHAEPSQTYSNSRLAIGPDPERPFTERYINLPPRPSVQAAITFSPDGRFLAFGGGTDADEAFVWDLRSTQPPKRLAGPKGSYREVRYLSDGSLALNTFSGLSIYRSDLSGHREAKGPKFPNPPDLPKGFGEGFNERKQIQLLPDGKSAMSTAFLGDSSAIWEIATGKVLRNFSGSAFGESLFTANGDRRVTRTFGPGAQIGLAIRSVTDGKTFWSNRDYRALFAVSFSPDGNLLACMGSRQQGRAAPESFLVLLDAATGKTLRETPLTSIARSAVFSPDGKQILVANKDLRIYGVNDLKPLAEATGQFSTRCQAAYSPNGRLIAVAEHGVKLYDARDLRLLVTLIPFEKQGWVAFTPSGAVNGSPDGLARLFKRTDSGITPLTGPIRPEEIKRALSGD